MSTANSKETASHPSHPSFYAPKHAHTHQKVVGRGLLWSMMERDAELLFPRPEHRKVNMDPSLKLLMRAAPTYTCAWQGFAGSAERRRCLQGLGWEIHPQPSSRSDSPMKQHSSSRGLVCCFFPREVRSYFYTLVTAFGLSVKRGRFHSKCFG